MSSVNRNRSVRFCLVVTENDSVLCHEVTQNKESEM